MKMFLTAAAMVFTAGAAFADPVEGVWQTKKDDNGNFGFVEVKPCGPAFCGVLIKSFDSAGAPIDSPNIGRKIIWDMVPYADGLYDDGQIYSPDRDKTYSASMQLTGDALSVSGCVLGGLICRAQDWSRVK